MNDISKAYRRKWKNPHDLVKKYVYDFAEDLIYNYQFSGDQNEIKENCERINRIVLLLENGYMTNDEAMKLMTNSYVISESAEKAFKEVIL